MLFSCSVVSDSLWSHGLQQARPPCPSLSPKISSNSSSVSQWCYPTISSSVIPFSSCLQSFPASFPMSQFFTSGGQNIGASASASVLPMNIQGWFPLGLWILWSPCSPRDSQVYLPQLESINYSTIDILYNPAHTSIHDYWKNHRYNYVDLCQQSDVSAF